MTNSTIWDVQYSVLVECCKCGTIDVLQDIANTEGWSELEPAEDMGVSHVGYCSDCFPEVKAERGDVPDYELDNEGDSSDGQEN